MCPGCIFIHVHSDICSWLGPQLRLLDKILYMVFPCGLSLIAVLQTAKAFLQISLGWPYFFMKIISNHIIMRECGMEDVAVILKNIYIICQPPLSHKIAHISHKENTHPLLH